MAIPTMAILAMAILNIGYTCYGCTYYGPSSSCAGMHIPCICHAYTMPAYTPCLVWCVQRGGQLPPRRWRLAHRQVRGARLPRRGPGRRAHHARQRAAERACLRLLGRAGGRRGRPTWPRHARSLAGGHYLLWLYDGYLLTHSLTRLLTYTYYTLTTRPRRRTSCASGCQVTRSPSPRRATDVT